MQVLKEGDAVSLQYWSPAYKHTKLEQNFFNRLILRWNAFPPGGEGVAAIPQLWHTADKGFAKILLKYEPLSACPKAQGVLTSLFVLFL